MKVFTVGFDQKPKMKEVELPKEKSESPPPGYPAHVKLPLPMGPEMPTHQPIIVRKSRGYKGILMVMLAVFLMAVFALTLSEIAYNRQRDENFFRLRWAELKNRLGYSNPDYDYYRRFGAPGRGFDRSRELMETVTTTTPPTTSLPAVIVPEPQLGEIINTNNNQSPLSNPLQQQSLQLPEEPFTSSDQQQQFSGSSSSSSSSASSEQQQDPNGMIRDARLMFLKNILQKIKQHAQEMGFDGTMQVSVIEVDPQAEEVRQRGSGGHQQQGRQIYNGFFPLHPMVDPQSSAFLDGFGEFHQPSFMQNNQVFEENRHPEMNNLQQQQPFSGLPAWPRGNPIEGPSQQGMGLPWFQHGENMPRFPQESSPFFQPNWQQQSFPQNQQQQSQFQQPQSQMPFQMAPQQQQFPQPSQVLPRPAEQFENNGRWMNGVPMGENNPMGGSNVQPQIHPPSPPFAPQQSPMQSAQMPMQMTVNYQPPQPIAPTMDSETQREEKFDNNMRIADTSSGQSPNAEAGSEVYGRKFGRMLQDIIANRVHNFQQMQQMNGLPQQMNIQSPLPMMPQQQQQFQFQGEPNPFVNNKHNIMIPSMLPQLQQQHFPQPQQPMPLPQWQNQQPQQPIQPLPQLPQQPSMPSSDNKEREQNQQQDQNRPSPILFFPIQQQAPIMPSEANKEQQQSQSQEQQLSFFKNLVPADGRIQIEPPAPSLPTTSSPVVSMVGDGSDRQQMDKQQQMGSGWSSGIEGSTKIEVAPAPQPQSTEVMMGPADVKGIIVDNNSGPRGWTHQEPQNHQRSGEVIIGGGEGDDHRQQQTSSSIGNGNVDSNSHESGSNSEDKFLVAPPRFASSPSHEEPQHQSNDQQQLPTTSIDSSAPIVVDFPAVKFPQTKILNGPASNQQDPSGGHPDGPTEQQNQQMAKDQSSGMAISVADPPQQSQHDAVQQPQQQPQLASTNPVFFQVDDPNEQQQDHPAQEQRDQQHKEIQAALP